MLDGFAYGADDEDYERTYLDNIKIHPNYYPESYVQKPIHIDKLFQNEDAYNDAPFVTI